MPKTGEPVKWIHGGPKKPGRYVMIDHIGRVLCATISRVEPRGIPGSDDCCLWFEHLKINWMTDCVAMHCEVVDGLYPTSHGSY
jgi:hypothetical protein